MLCQSPKGCFFTGIGRFFCLECVEWGCNTDKSSQSKWCFVSIWRCAAVLWIHTPLVDASMLGGEVVVGVTFVGALSGKY